MKKQIIRFIRIDLTRFLMKSFWAFPLRKNQVFFSAYEGKQFSCNPKIIFEKMCNDPEFSNFKFVWELNDSNKHSLIKRGNVKFVKHNSFRYFHGILTSKFIVTNTGLTGRIPLRKNQININTWHGGGAYKCVGHAINSDISGDLKELNIASAQTTYFLSSSEIFTNVMIDSIRLPKERFVPIGMPRNDIFFDTESCNKLRVSILKRYNLDNDDFLILYAPTYRGAVGENTFSFDLAPLHNLRKTVEKKFGRKAVLMIRMHYYSDKDEQNENAISVSGYPDMQELLAAVDMLVTDYSSSMWDFGLSGKPCILYTPDINNYDLDRGFYTSPSEWPGILCETEEEMIEAVNSFNNDDYQKKLKRYFKETGSYDRGNATQKTIQLITERL